MLVKQKIGGQDEGFTLLEAIVATVITGLFVAVAAPLLTSVSTSLGRTADATIATQSALRTSRMLRFDFSGSQRVYVLPTLAPSVRDASPVVCSSALSQSGNFNAWGDQSNWKTSKIIRPLFTVDVIDLPLSQADITTGWIKSQRVLVGYEVRRAASPSPRSPYELWRVVCDGTPKNFTDSKGVVTATVLAVTSEERLTVIGDGSDALPSSVSGLSNLLCGTATSATSTFCGVDDANATIATVRAAFYNLRFPYAGSGSSAVLRNLINSSTGTLQSRLGAGS